MSLRRILPVVLLIAGLALGASAQDGKTPLTLKLEPGATRVIEVRAKVTSERKMLGDQIRHLADITARYNLKVESVDKDGDIKFSAVLKTLQATEDSTIGDHEFNPFGNTEGRSPLQEIARVVIDMPFSFVASKSGEVKAVHVSKKAQEAIAEKADLVPAKIADDMTDKEKQEFVDRILVRLRAKACGADMAKIFSVLPEEPVGPGDTWTVKPVKGPGSSATIRREMHYVKREGNLITVDVKGQFASKPGKDEFDVKGTIKGTLSIDAETGLCQSGTYDVVTKGKDRDGVFSDMKASIKGTFRILEE
ncbi:MAG: hypothetical protein GY851_35145 [bacterium]|nr:hypothetical protein [bacterium]